MAFQPQGGATRDTLFDNVAPAAMSARLRQSVQPAEHKFFRPTGEKLFLPPSGMKLDH
jgi:hypothetical protein